MTKANGSGIKNARLTLTDTRGNSQTVLTGKVGAYRFREIAAGETYIISVAAKRFTFSQPTQIRAVNEETTEINFIAYED